MLNRRNVLQSAVLAAFATVANAQLKRTELFAQDLPSIDGAGLKVTVVELQYEAGGTSQSHRHPGPTFVYVLEGALFSQVEGGAVKTYTAGQMFYEPPGGVHMVSKNASDTKPARFLAFFLSEKGKPLTVPA